MRALPTLGICGRLLVALALTMPGPVGAQEVNPPPGEQAPRTERLMRGFEPKRAQTVRIRPDAYAPADRRCGNVWTPGARGDFVTPEECQRGRW